MPNATPDSADAGPIRGLRSREVALIVAFWTFLAILISANRLTDPRAADRPVTPASGPILLTLFEAYLWAALTPLIFWLARRLSLTRRQWLGRLALLLAVGAGLAFVVTLATTF